MYLGEWENDIEALLPTVDNRISPFKELPGTNAKTGSEKNEKFVAVVNALVLGPAMLYAGLGKTPPKPLQAALLLTGIGTIIYNVTAIGDK